MRDVTTAVDRACSRFREDSELIVRTAELERGAEVSPMLASLVRQALEAAHVSDGDVDPTLGNQMASIGYDTAFNTSTRTHPAAAGVAGELDTRPVWQQVLLRGRFLRIPVGVRLDLGATAKAAAADMAVASVTANLGIGALVSLGGDVATAGPDPAGGWQVRVQDLESDPVDRVQIASGWSVATSSTQKRRWEQDGHARHHILDPRWGVPAEPVWRSVTVVAPSCTTANTLSTAAIVRGRAAPEMLRASGRAARLVSADGGVIRLGGWPRDDSGMPGDTGAAGRPAA